MNEVLLSFPLANTNGGEKVAQDDEVFAARASHCSPSVRPCWLRAATCALADMIMLWFDHQKKMRRSRVILFCIRIGSQNL